MAIPELNSASTAAPRVSVATTAYNLERWLPRAIESVLAQKTNFPIELVIGDDASRDATLSIAHSYREQHPDVIRVIERERNVGIQRNTWETLEQCRGKYTAWLDADDYWTDPDKLAIQVKTLESDPTVQVCCHYVRWVTSDGAVKRDRYPSLAAGRYGMREILKSDFVATPSVMFRTGIHRQLPAWYFDLPSLSDWPLWVLSALSGDILLLDRIMADYMLTPGSSLTSKGAMFWYEMDAAFYEQAEGILPRKWHRLARAEKCKRYESMAYLLRKQGDFTASRKAALKAFCSPHPLDRVGSKTKSLVAAVVREAEWRLKGAQSPSME